MQSACCVLTPLKSVIRLLGKQHLSERPEELRAEVSIFVVRNSRTTSQKYNVNAEGNFKT